MNLSDISTKITELTGCSTTDYPNANRLINLNIWYDKIHTMILQSQDEWDFDDSNNDDFPILTTDLVASQQDYPLPTGSLAFNRVEVSYDGTNWYKAPSMDIKGIEISTDTTSIADNFSTDEPCYDIRANSIFLYPIPSANVTAGLKVWIDRNMTLFTTTDLVTNPTEVFPGFDRNFHPMLAFGGAFEWAVAKKPELAPNFKVVLDDYEARLRAHYGKKQKDGETIISAYNFNFN